MQHIEINTTQNVRITYEVAHLGDRIFAFLIDLLVIGAGFLGSMMISGLISGEATSWVFYLISAPFFMFYTLVSEIAMKGQTIGKRALNIQIVKINGKEAQIEDYFLRWVFRLIDIYLSVGTIAALFIGTSKKSQRLGDLVAETTAIRIKPTAKLTFNDIQNKYRLDDYQPQFPGVQKLSESDMLMVQTVMLRYTRYKNEAHTAILFELVKKIKDKLNLHDDDVRLDPVSFLKTLIKDYVILTRQ